MASRHRETLKKIQNSLSDEERLKELLLKKLHQSVLRGNKVDAGILAKAIKILYPKTSDVLVANAIFKAHWKVGRHSQAIQIYRKAGRIIWFADDVGHYYEKHGLMSKAIEEYEYLMDVYSGLSKDFLPLPKGPRELFVLGKWYARRNKVKARKYLELYLSAETKCGGDPAYFLRHKNEAHRILDRLCQ